MGSVPCRVTLRIYTLCASNSTIGPFLAEQFETSFAELDHEIGESAGLPLDGLFGLQGASYSHTLEHQAVAGCLLSAILGLISLVGIGAIN